MGLNRREVMLDASSLQQIRRVGRFFGASFPGPAVRLEDLLVTIRAPVSARRCKWRPGTRRCRWKTTPNSSTTWTVRAASSSVTIRSHGMCSSPPTVGPPHQGSYDVRTLPPYLPIASPFSET
jgi:hypothetical protein